LNVAGRDGVSKNLSASLYFPISLPGLSMSPLTYPFTRCLEVNVHDRRDGECDELRKEQSSHQALKNGSFIAVSLNI